MMSVSTECRMVGISLLVAIGVLAGCTTTVSSIDTTMAAWMGHDFNDLVADWGPPNSVSSDGKGGQILTYSYKREFTTPGYYSADTNMYPQTDPDAGARHPVTEAKLVYTPPQAHKYTATRTFWVSSSGVIYRTEWDGE